MSVTLSTNWQKVCEVSTKITQNITGYTRLYMKYGNRDIANNRDTIYYEIRQFAYNPYGTYDAWQWLTPIAWSIKSGNTTKASGTIDQSAWIKSYKTDTTTNEVVKASGSYTQTHNADGTFSDTLTFTAPIYNTTYTTTGSIVLPTIPRYATATQQLASKEETKIKINWSSDSTIDYIWYSTNNGSSWTAVGSVNSNSGSYTINSLTANTTYNVKTKVRKKDSQLETISDPLSITTYNYPYANSMPNFTIGNTLKIGLYNPLGRSVQVYFVCSNNTEVGGDTTTGTSISGYTSSTATNAMYSSIPNTKNGSYKVRVKYGSASNITKNGGTYSINENNCKPTISTLTYQDTNSSTTTVTTNNQKIVQNKSIVQYTATGVNAQNSATISTCQLVVNGNTYNLTRSGSTATGGNATINSESNVTATLTVTDSRGLSSTKSVNVSILAWKNPTATITAERVNNYEDTTNLKVVGSISSVDSKNSIQNIKYRYKKTTDSTYSAYTNISNNTQYTLTLDKNYAWNFQLVITDRLDSTTYNFIVPKGQPIFFLDIDKLSVGVNCFPTNNSTFECALPMIDRNGHKVNEFNSRPKNFNFTPTENERGTFRVDLGGSSPAGLPNQDGYIMSFYWDNSGRYDTQIFFPNADGNNTSPPKYRCKNNASSWGNWYSLGRKELVCARLNAHKDITISSTYTNYVIPLNNTSYLSSKTFELTSDGGVKIKKAGTYMINTNVMLYASAITDLIVRISRKKASDSSTAGSMCAYTREYEASKWMTISLTDFPLTVEANDIIYLNVQTSNTCTVKVGGNNSVFTYMTIKEI